MDKLIIGVGTGRCGTKSLTRLLEYQENTKAKHERFGPRVRWNCPPNLWPMRLWNDTMRKDHGVSCDVAFYWTPNVDSFVEWGRKYDRSVRVVGLKRDRQGTIESYNKWKPNSDHWSYHGFRDTKQDEWDHCYPSFCTDSKKEGIGRFWDYTYKMLEEFEDKYEEVKVFDSFDCFNTESGVKSILDHCGYDSPKVETELKVKAPDIDQARNSVQW